MSYSLDFRKKVLSIRRKEGLTLAKAAARFDVGLASVSRWCKRVEPQKTRNKPATKISSEALMQDVRDYPDAYQYERAQRLGVSQKGIGQALRRLGFTHKKNTVTSESGRKRKTCLPG